MMEPSRKPTMMLALALLVALVAATFGATAAEKATGASPLPYGAEGGGPSLAIFPAQTLPLRFDHRVHTGLGRSCTSCHAAATTSTRASDRLLPSPRTCDECHGTSHENLLAVVPGRGPAAACGFCHEGHEPEDGPRVPRVVVPAPNLHFNHAVHGARNIGCGQCHGDVAKVEKATRDQLPRMLGCLRCHDHPIADARGTAKADCETCHLTAPFGEHGRIRTEFPSGKLLPPRWMHGAEHTPDFLARHKMVAGNDSQFCGSCHREEFCVECHDGRVRPRTVHPNDYVSMHGVEARLRTQRCESCHRDQSFCLDCHMRTGTSESGPPGVRTAGRFHPPKEIWSDAPRRPGHHGTEAQRNLNACVSCHTERDCVSCHASRGIGGGMSPHRAGFLGRCGAELARNPRPCLVCHEDGPELDRCR